MNKVRYFLLIILFICFLSPSGMTAATNQQSDTEETIRIPLTRNDDYINAIFHSLTFDDERVKEILEKHNVKLPEELTSSSSIGYASSDDTVVMLQKMPDKDVVLLTVDANRNYDLTNDEEKELKIPEDRNDPEQTKIYLKATYSDGGWEYHPLFFFAFQGRDPSAPPRISYGLGYSYQTTFFQDGKEYRVNIQDPTMDGIFKAEDIEDQNFLSLAVKKGDKWEYIHQGFELIPVGKEIYQAHAVAEDGSWIELKKSTLHPAAIGRPAPDFQ